MATEDEIRKALAQACETRGKKAELAELFEVSQSTVTRWVDGKEISAPMLKLLDWYFFGTMPPALAAKLDLAGTLEFTEDQWRLVELMARRAGQTASQWIRSTIVHYLEFSSEAAAARDATDEKTA